MIRITGNPQAVEKNSQFSGHGHDGSFLAIFPATFEHSSAPAFKVAVRAKTSQQILRTLNQQRAELIVSGLADSELLLDIMTVRKQWPEIRRICCHGVNYFSCPVDQWWKDREFRTRVMSECRKIPFCVKKGFISDVPIINGIVM